MIKCDLRHTHTRTDRPYSWNSDVDFEGRYVGLIKDKLVELVLGQIYYKMRYYGMYELLNRFDTKSKW